MIDVTQAVKLGWVTDCGHCADLRKALDALRDGRKWSAYDGTTAEAKGLDNLRIVCHSCDGRGWRLTADGQMLVDLVQELYPELVQRTAEDAEPS